MKKYFAINQNSCIFVYQIRQIKNKKQSIMRTNNILEVMYEGDKSKESNKFEAAIIELFKTHRPNAGAKVQIIKAHYEDRRQVSGVYRCRKIGNLDYFLADIAGKIGFEIAGRSQCSDSVTLINEEGFKISATAVED